MSDRCVKRESRKGGVKRERWQAMKRIRKINIHENEEKDNIIKELRHQ